MHWLKHRITRKLLKIDRYMLRGVWQALKCLSINATYCVIIAGASPGETSTQQHEASRGLSAIAELLVRVNAQSISYSRPLSTPSTSFENLAQLGWLDHVANWHISASALFDRTKKMMTTLPNNNKLLQLLFVNTNLRHSDVTVTLKWYQISVKN